MLFDTPPVFPFAFLPAMLAVFFLLGRFGVVTVAALRLALGSLVFYAWDDPSYLLPRRQQS